MRLEGCDVGVAVCVAMVRDAQAKRPALLTMRVEFVGVMGAWLYILRCADSSYYTGKTRTDLEVRIA